MRIIPPLRISDKHGEGHFGAPRGNHKHRGEDIACYKGSIVLSISRGVVTKIGYPYDPNDPIKGHLRYVQVSLDGLDYRYFYIESSVSVGDIINVDDPLGKTAGLTKIYPGIIDHFHFEVKQGRLYLDPTDFL